jgi:hypothetical protein
VVSAAWRRVLGLSVVAVLGTVLAWWLSRRLLDPTSALFRRLPAEHLVLAYLDVEQLRRAPALAPLLKSRVEPDADYAAFVKQTGFDYERDLDAAAICYLSDRVYILARGRFAEERLRKYAEAQGGSCAGPGLRQPCRVPASRPGLHVSFYLLSPDHLAIATAPEPDAVLQLRSKPSLSAEPLAREVSARNRRPALLWATLTPGALDRTLPGAVAFSPNLALLAKALGNSQRAYLFLTDRAPSLEISLEAACATEQQAAEMQRLFQGLHDLIGGLMRTARGAKPPEPWERVVTSAQIEQRQNSLHAAWTLDETVLKSLSSSR